MPVDIYGDVFDHSDKMLLALAATVAKRVADVLAQHQPTGPQPHQQGEGG